MTDEEKTLALLGSVCALAAAWWWIRREDAGEGTGDAGLGALYSEYVDPAVTTVQTALGLWHPPARYAGAIAAAEDRHGLPRDLLARLLWQESRYREDIITGRTRSSVGALGIAQFMPATAADFGVDPLEPFQAIEGAARYLGQLFRQFGNWPEALAAYNWGPGNVKRKGLAAAPLETRNYYTQILADIGGAAYA